MKNHFLQLKPFKHSFRRTQFLLVSFGLLITAKNFAQVGISSTSITPDASSILELRSTTAGFLPPRMTTTQRDAITSPATGLLIYNTTTNQLNYYNSGWQVITVGGQVQLNGTGFVKVSGTTISYDNSTYLTGNQSITWTGGGDVSGSANGTTSISPSLTITGLRGVALPTLSSGLLKYNGSSWAFDNSSYITNANVVFNNQSNTYGAGFKQIFAANGTNADIRLAGNTSDPSSLSAGDIWYNSTSNVFKGRFNTTTRQFATLDGTEAFTNKDLTGSGNTFPTFNQNTTGQSGSVANPLTIGTNLQGTSSTYNGSTGVTLSLQNAAADGTTKGAAGFNGTNFTASSGIINTIQDITTTSNVQHGTIQTGTLLNTPASNWVLAGRQSANNRPTLVLQRQTNTSPTGDFISLYDAGTTPAKLFNIDITGTVTAGTWNGSSIPTTYTDAKIKTVTGTTNRIAIGGTSTDPTFDISSSYVGQNTITTLGTITTGVWNGTALNSTYLPSATVYNNQSNTYSAGFKQIFVANGTNADIRLAGNTSDPSTLSAGDMWYNTTSNVFKGRFNATTRQFATLDGTEAFTNKDLTGSGNTFPTFNQNTTGTAANVTGTVAVANGGTGQTSALIAGGVMYGSSTTAAGVTSAGTTGQVLQSNGSSAPTWVEGGTMMFTGLSNNTAVSNTTLFFPLLGAMAGSTTDLTAGTRSLVSRPGSINNLIVRVSAALAAGKTGSVTVYKNGVATALSVTLTVGPLTFTDNSNSVTVVAGDELSVKVTTTGAVKFSWAADFSY